MSYHPGYKTQDGPVPVVSLDPPFDTVFMATNVHDDQVIRGFGLSPADAVAVALNHTEIYMLGHPGLDKDSAES